MWIVFIIVIVLIYFLVIKPFRQRRNAQNFAHYMMLPEEIRRLIIQERVLELASVLVELELDKNYKLAEMTLNAIDSQGFSFANRVDKIRNELRIEAGLGPLS